MSPEADARAYELVQVQGLSYAAAGKRFDPPLPKSSIRNAVARELKRRAVPPAPGEPDRGFLATLLAADATETRGYDETPTPPADRLHVASPADEDDVLVVDAETIIRKQIAKVARMIDELNAVNNVGEAQKYSRTLAGLSHDLRQIEKAKRDDAGVLTYTLADVEAVRADLRKKVQDVKHRPFTCAECGRRLRQSEAEGET